jgi:hypothetical protein
MLAGGLLYVAAGSLGTFSAMQGHEPPSELSLGLGLGLGVPMVALGFVRLLSLGAAERALGDYRRGGRCATEACVRRWQEELARSAAMVRRLRIGEAVVRWAIAGAGLGMVVAAAIGAPNADDPDRAPWSARLYGWGAALGGLGTLSGVVALVPGAFERAFLGRGGASQLSWQITPRIDRHGAGGALLLRF